MPPVVALHVDYPISIPVAVARPCEIARVSIVSGRATAGDPGEQYRDQPVLFRVVRFDLCESQASLLVLECCQRR